MAESKRGVGKKISDDELAKMSKEKRDKILLARKERVDRLKELASTDIEALATESTSEREYNAKFNKMYAFVRKGFVVLKAKKVTGDLSGEELFNEATALLEKALEF
jgi:hypothetical protein